MNKFSVSILSAITVTVFLGAGYLYWHNMEANRFPGFTKVKTSGEAGLYVDLQSVTTGSYTSFKMISISNEGGHTINDAATDCHDRFRKLDGVQYKDDGTTQNSIYGDVAWINFNQNADLTALVQLVCAKVGYVTLGQMSPTQQTSQSTKSSNEPDSNNSALVITGDTNNLQLPLNSTGQTEVARPATASKKLPYPQSLKNVVTVSDWPKVRQALAFAYSLGDQKNYVQWNNPKTGSNGSVFQSGDGVDPDGCRQFRVVNQSKAGPPVGLIEVCPRGRYK